MTASIPKFPTYFVSLSSLSLFEYSGGQHKVRIKFLPGAHNMQSLERLGTIRQINHYTYFKLQQPKQILHCRNRFAGLFSSFLKYQYYSRHLASLLKNKTHINLTPLQESTSTETNLHRCYHQPFPACIPPTDTGHWGSRGSTGTRTHQLYTLEHCSSSSWPPCFQVRWRSPRDAEQPLPPHLVYLP